MNKGFTLIELLVVVLIIGILTSVAVPRYFKVIEKSRFVNVQTLAKSLGDAQERYRELYGESATKFENIDITLKDTASASYCDALSTSDALQDNNFYYCIDAAPSVIWKGTIGVLRKSGRYANTGFIWANKRIYCVEFTGSKKMCKELLNGTFYVTDHGWDLFEVQ